MQNGINARPIHGWNLFIGERVVWMAFLLLVPCCCFHISAHLCSALRFLCVLKMGFALFFLFFYLLRRHHACPWRYTGTHVNYHNLNFVNWTCFLWVYCIFVATSAIIFRFEFVSSSVQKHRLNRKSMRDIEKKSGMHKIKMGNPRIAPRSCVTLPKRCLSTRIVCKYVMEPVE